MSASVFVSHGDIEATLAAVPVVGKRLLEPLASLARDKKLPFKIIEDHQVPVSECEVHMTEGDLWSCLEGKVQFTVGGKLVAPMYRKNSDGSDNVQELVADSIEGGQVHILEKGDWLWIPAGEPHLHVCDETARLMIIKIPHA